MAENLADTVAGVVLAVPLIAAGAFLFAVGLIVGLVVG